MVRQEGLNDKIDFLGWIPRSKLLELLPEYDVLVFPSIWEEPFARIILEAMAAGLTVIGTNTGGSKEILINGVNGLAFEAEDAQGLASQIMRLWACPDLCWRLAQAGRQVVQEEFTLNGMVNEIEQFLVDIANSTQQPVT